MKKSTDKLLDTLKKKPTIEEYLFENSAELIDCTTVQALGELLEKKKLTKAEVIRSANIDRTYGYQIFDGRKSPSRDKLIMICFGLKLNLDETQRLLKIAGLRELYPRDSRDAIISFSILHNMSLIDANEILYDKGLKPLGENENQNK